MSLVSETEILLIVTVPPGVTLGWGLSTVSPHLAIVVAAKEFSILEPWGCISLHAVSLLPSSMYSEVKRDRPSAQPSEDVP